LANEFGGRRDVVEIYRPCGLDRFIVFLDVTALFLVAKANAAAAFFVSHFEASNAIARLRESVLALALNSDSAAHVRPSLWPNAGDLPRLQGRDKYSR